MSSNTSVFKADLNQSEHQSAVVALMDAYSADSMGDGKSLSEYARENLIAGLRSHPTTQIFLAFCDNNPVGIAVCFRGFSTFAARPLINVSDFYVKPAARGPVLVRELLEAIEQHARAEGCGNLTPEVQENKLAREKSTVILRFRVVSTRKLPAGGVPFQATRFDEYGRDR